MFWAWAPFEEADGYSVVKGREATRHIHPSDCGIHAVYNGGRIMERGIWDSQFEKLKEEDYESLRTAYSFMLADAFRSAME
ncbi:hypothetical protein DL767_005308 [Monosporascus sp. MG133]|nr:hypothetical protein DL767_005308 [Monosporascus sp. MG133]